MKLMLFAIVVVFVLMVIFLVLQRHRQRSIMIREQRARDRANEQPRVVRPPRNPSPLPDMEYDFWRGEESLVNPNENALDIALREVAQRFASEDEATKANLRNAIHLREFYTLLTFGKRASVFAMRQRSVSWVTDGLAALAMVEANRLDPRDILMTLSLLYHAAMRIEANPDRLLREAALLSSPKMAELLRNHCGRYTKLKNLRSAWGHTEVETENGVGIIGWEGRKYHPTINLASVVIEIATLFESDQYQSRAISIAESFPAIWLTTDQDSSAEELLKHSRGGASILVILRPENHSRHRDQNLRIFLVEMEDEQTADALLGCARRRTEPVMLALAERKLFCLVIQTSSASGYGSVPFETSESLARFSNGIVGILRRYSESIK
jgi:hypothetical protein